MSQTINYSFNQNDNNYASAVNYDGTDFFNCPMTFEINNTLFIVPFGSMDSKQVKISDNLVYIVAENTGLDYISMVVIDLSDNSTLACSFTELDILDKDHSCYGIFDKELDKQIKILSEYIY